MADDASTTTTAENSPISSSEKQLQENATTQKEKRFLETVVNGKKVKVAEDDLLRDYGKYNSANEKFQSAAQLRKENEAFERKLAEDPEAFMNDSRIPKAKRREIAEKILMHSLEEEMQPQLSQEQQELNELRKFKQSREQEVEETKTKAEQAEFQKVVEQRKESLAKTFQDAIALTSLSKHEGTSAEVVREMATYMRLCKQAGHEVTPQELAKHVEDRFMSSYKGLTDSMSGADLVNFLGEGIVKKLRQYDLGQLEARRGGKQPEQASSWESNTKPKAKREFIDPQKIIRDSRK